MKYFYPIKIIAKGDGVDAAEFLSEKSVLQIGLSEQRVFKMQGKTFLILDFGRELSGGVRILTYHADGKKSVRLRFGESVSETCAELGEKNAGNDHSNRDFTVQLQSFSDMIFGNTGFRFLRMDTIGEDTALALKSIVACSDADEREEIGFFECNDETINNIWNTAAYTLRLCLHNGFLWDGVKRDRLVWIGDLYPEMKSAQCLYGQVPEVENSLRYAREQTPLPEWMNGIPMYSFWWLIVLCDNYFRNGKKEFVAENLGYIKSLVLQIARFVRENGETDFCYNFVDWPSHYDEGESFVKKQEELAGVNYLLRLAMEKTASLLRDFGERTCVCEEVLSRLKKKSFDVRFSKSMAALGILSGDDSKGLCNTLLDKGAQGVSTFMSYQIFSAMGQLGEHDLALSVLKTYYGEMLRLGATTFWENFDIQEAENAASIDSMPSADKTDIHGDGGAHCYKGFRHSLCHGWSSGVIAYLSEAVLGIRVSAYLGKVLLFPHLGGLKWVRGACPTPFGRLYVEHTINSKGKIVTNISAPEDKNTFVIERISE